MQAIYDGASNPRTHQQIWPGFLPGSETFWREVLVGNPNAPGGSSASFFKDGVFAGQSGFSYLNINFDSDVALTNNKPAGTPANTGRRRLTLTIPTSEPSNGMAESC